MPRFLEIALKPDQHDFRGDRIRKNVASFLHRNFQNVTVRKLYAFDIAMSDEEWSLVAQEFTDPVIEYSVENHTADTFDFVVKIGFNPGVTDNEGRTAKELTSIILGRHLSDDEAVYTSKIIGIYTSDFTKEKVRTMALALLANTLIESVEIYDRTEWQSTTTYTVPKITAHDDVHVARIATDITDEALVQLSKERTLSLSCEEMQAIRAYFSDPHVQSLRIAQGIGAQATDAEIEMLAQTWSEHCKHKIFAAEIDYNDADQGTHEKIQSLFKTYIVNATEAVAKKRDFLVSVFHDNAGVIRFNNDYHVCYKAETHNSPSALDPYGGAMTGIVGVNRDVLGTGKGAVPHVNVWGYCFADPDFKGEIPQGLMHPKRIRDGVHQGVIDGGNQSGIPYGRGWELFDDRFLGKPLVFCGTVGLIPAEATGKDFISKKAHPGDFIVMAGGRIGKDGIHGATFSSVELNESSPVQAVQIGDPITQKMMTDFLLEARDKELYSSITDNGAGGLSSSIGEMCRDSGGAFIDLAKAPLKYHGLEPWEILISEAQERMSLAVPPSKIDAFLALAKKRGVEATVLGTFTDSGYFHAVYNELDVVYIAMTFLHDGVPKLQLKAEWRAPKQTMVSIQDASIAESMVRLAGSLNLRSREYIARHYDHEVKGLTVVKPLGGVNADVMTDAAVFGVDDTTYEGIVLTEAVNPYYSDIDTYHMTASVIDEALRKAVTIGVDPAHCAGLDNFCWPDPVYDAKVTPDGQYKLAQLVRSCKALSDYTRAYGVPCVSGKDSMKNDARLAGKKISIPPTLLFSLIGKIHDYRKAVTMDPKKSGDGVYILGSTHNELGGSEYSRLHALNGGMVPTVDSTVAAKLYDVYAKAVEQGLVRSAHSPHKGGIAYSLMLQALAGDCGITIHADAIPSDAGMSVAELLFSESNSRIIATVAPEKIAVFEALFKEHICARIGTIERNAMITIYHKDIKIVELSCDTIMSAYKERV